MRRTMNLGTISAGSADFIALNSHISVGPKSSSTNGSRPNSGSRAAIAGALSFFTTLLSLSQRKPGYTHSAYIVPFGTIWCDLVLLGHDHLYGRTPKINGTMYLTSGGGGSGLYSGQVDAQNEVCIEKHHFVKMSVEPARISWTAIDSTGDIIEQYELTKPRTTP